jgi:hypothetical protein
MRKLLTLAIAALGAMALVACYPTSSKAEGIAKAPKKAAARPAPAPQPEDYVASIFADAPVAKLDWTGFYVGALVGNTSFDADTREWELGGTAGFDWQVRNTALVLGARASLVRVGLDAGDDELSGDLRAGIAMGTALPYVFAGYGWLLDDTDVRARRLGVGVEWRLSSALSNSFVHPTLALEYMRRDGEDDGVAHTGMARLNFRFGDGYVVKK